MSIHVQSSCSYLGVEPIQLCLSRQRHIGMLFLGIIILATIWTLINYHATFIFNITNYSSFLHLHNPFPIFLFLYPSLSLHTVLSLILTFLRTTTNIRTLAIYFRLKTEKILPSSVLNNVKLYLISIYYNKQYRARSRATTLTHTRRAAVSIISTILHDASVTPRKNTSLLFKVWNEMALKQA